MATISTTKSAGSSLDVASIVSQLMAIERKPLAALTTKIEKSQIKVSSLGQFQSKLSALNDATKRLQTPALFNNHNVNTADTTVLTASLGTGVLPGSYDVTVSSLATNAVVKLTPQLLTPTDSYWFRVGSTDVNFSVALPTDNSSNALKAHYEALRDKINADATLKDRFVAVLVDRWQGDWSLTIQGLETGSANNIQLMKDSDPSAATTTLTQVAGTAFRSATDATFTLNGVDYTRTSNSVEMSGLKLDLLKRGTTSVEVRKTTVSYDEPIKALVTAYNDLLAQYKSLTVSSTDASVRGVLNSDSALASVMRQVNAQLTGTLSYSGGGTLSGVGALGLAFADDGQLVYKPELVTNSETLQTALSKGLYLGASQSNNLSTYLDSSLVFGGMLYERIQAEKNVQSDLTRRQGTLEEKMVKLQERYTAQYAALDALLFKLNSTNTALKGALDALAASQKSN